MYNILVCDDEKDIVSALKIYLTADGYQVYEAYNGKQAIEVLREQQIHLVLMDIMMPEMDGYEASRQIRAMNRPDAKTVPIIALTANAFTEDAQRAAEAGMDAHMTKPFDFDKLKKCMSEIKQSGRSPERRTSLGARISPAFSTSSARR